MHVSQDYYQLLIFFSTGSLLGLYYQDLRPIFSRATIDTKIYTFKHHPCTYNVPCRIVHCFKQLVTSDGNDSPKKNTKYHLH